MKTTESRFNLDIAPSYDALFGLKEVLLKALIQSEDALQTSLVEKGLPIDPSPLMPYRILTRAIESAHYEHTGYTPGCFLDPYKNESPSVYYRMCVHTKRLISEIDSKLENFSDNS